TCLWHGCIWAAARGIFGSGEGLETNRVRDTSNPGRLIAAFVAAVLLGGCTSMLRDAPLATYDLTAPSSFSGRAAAGKGVLVVEEPAASRTVDSNRMVARSGGQISYVPGAQWTDRLPSLVQTRIVQAFENAGRIGSVGRSQDRLAGDYQLITDIRAFEI